jgi:hypothetical protein
MSQNPDENPSLTSCPEGEHRDKLGKCVPDVTPSTGETYRVYFQNESKLHDAIQNIATRYRGFLDDFNANCVPAYKISSEAQWLIAFDNLFQFQERVKILREAAMFLEHSYNSCVEEAAALGTAAKLAEKTADPLQIAKMVGKSEGILEAVKTFTMPSLRGHVDVVIEHVDKLIHQYMDSVWMPQALAEKHRKRTAETQKFKDDLKDSR